MFFENRHGVFIGRFRGLSKRTGFIHGFSMRKGGVSKPPYDTLNLGLNTEDEYEAAEENRRRFWRAVAIDPSRAAAPRQIHGDRILSVQTPGIFPDTDALITNRSNIFLVVQTADCLPVFLVDPVQRAVGLVHAGWKGSVLRVTAKTVQAMIDEFGTEPGHVEAYLGPSIGPCCYAVGEDVSNQFEASCVRDGKLDLWRANVMQLVSSGVDKLKIEVSRLCTACHHDWFFSHRVSGGRTGRMMGVIGLVS